MNMQVCKRPEESPKLVHALSKVGLKLSEDMYIY
jgi:hypothetical protein